MFGKAWKIGSIGGIPIRVDSSWIWIAVFVIYSLYARLEAIYHHLMLGAAALGALAVLGAALFFGSILLHELAHAGMARALRIPVEGITLFFLGGATSTGDEDRGPKAEFLVSVVGPLASLAAGGAFWALSRVIETSNTPLAGLLGYVGWWGVAIAIFNLVPGFPLDGGRVLLAIVWRVTGSRGLATRIAAGVGLAIGALMVLGGMAEITMRGNFFGLWLVFIGVFLIQASRASAQQERLREALAGSAVADVMSPPPPAIPGELSLSEALDNFLRGHEDEQFPVAENGAIRGLLTFESARQIGQHDPLRPVRDAMLPLSGILVVAPGDPLTRVSHRLGPGRAALVLDHGALVGAVTAGDVGRWLQRRATGVK